MQTKTWDKTCPTSLDANFTIPKDGEGARRPQGREAPQTQMGGQPSTSRRGRWQGRPHHGDNHQTQGKPPADIIAGQGTSNWTQAKEGWGPKPRPARSAGKAGTAALPKRALCQSALFGRCRRATRVTSKEPLRRAARRPGSAAAGPHKKSARVTHHHTHVRAPTKSPDRRRRGGWV